VESLKTMTLHTVFGRSTHPVPPASQHCLSSPWRLVTICVQTLFRSTYLATHCYYMFSDISPLYPTSATHHHAGALRESEEPHCSGHVV
jgi:hypothetical protein